VIEDLSNKTLSLWSWGSNRFGQLGQGNQIKKSMPKPINYILGYTNSQVIEVRCLINFRFRVVDFILCAHLQTTHHQNQMKLKNRHKFKN